jgi:hypothetical protein
VEERAHQELQQEPKEVPKIKELVLQLLEQKTFIC